MRLGILGTMVWDRIHARHGRTEPVEEWGGISYALAAAVSAAPPGTTEVRPLSSELTGPAYDALNYNITAGNPVYAPTPMRGLLDIQPCAQTQAADESALPFWKDFKNMLWARAAGDMQILYFYPLQPGFYLTDQHAVSLGLVNPKQPDVALPAEQRLGKCVPWLDKLTTGTVNVTYQDEQGADRQAKVLPVGYHAGWPDLPPLLTVGETVYERSKAGISGVATQLAVARIYELASAVEKAAPSASRSQAIRTVLLLVAPMMPHLAEEAWAAMAPGEGLVALAPWPEVDPALLVEDEVTVAVQVKGKLRDTLTVAKGTAKEELEALALASEKVQRALDGADVKKVIVVPDRLVNLVA